MEDYPSNSHSAPIEDPDDENPKNIQKVVTGPVITRKPSGFQRLRKSFIRADASTVGDQIFWNVLLPNAKDTVFDMGVTFLETMLFGERRSGSFRPSSSSTSSPSTSTSKFNYAGINIGGGPLVQSSGVPNVVDDHIASRSPNEFILKSRAESEGVIHEMDKIIEKYGAVTVADVYRMMGTTGSYMDHRWGWSSTEGAGSKRVRNGVLLVLPLPEDLT